MCGATTGTDDEFATNPAVATKPDPIDFADPRQKHPGKTGKTRQTVPFGAGELISYKSTT